MGNITTLYILGPFFLFIFLIIIIPTFNDLMTHKANMALAQQFEKAENILLINGLRSWLYLNFPEHSFTLSFRWDCDFNSYSNKNQLNPKVFLVKHQTISLKDDKYLANFFNKTIEPLFNEKVLIHTVKYVKYKYVLFVFFHSIFNFLTLKFKKNNYTAIIYKIDNFAINTKETKNKPSSHETLQMVKILKTHYPDWPIKNWC